MKNINLLRSYLHSKIKINQLFNLYILYDILYCVYSIDLNRNSNILNTEYVYCLYLINKNYIIIFITKKKKRN